MGGVTSSSKNNDDLVDNLLEADYIKTSMIERVFRAVDRAEYFLAEARTNAYKDIAWKSGNLHLSAPCIYSEVMEALCLEPGLSFLNLGSGTGYLSTMAGLILGSYGVNHGIEYHADVLQYANKKFEDFRKYSGAIDEFDYCEPKFIQGNCLCLTSECYARYDRVYCSAACPILYESYMKNLIKVGGILVMPFNDQLLQVKRKSESSWVVRSLLPVSFASIIQPAEGCQDYVQLIEVDPVPLQALCRTVIRNILRKNVEMEHPLVKRAPKVKRRVLRRLVVPLVESEDSSDEERLVRIGGYYVRELNNANNEQNGENTETEHLSEDNKMETGSTDSTDEKNKDSNKYQTKVETRAVIEHTPSTSHNSNLSSHRNGSESLDGSSDACRESTPDRREDDDDDDTSLDSINAIGGSFVDVLDVLRRNEEIDDSDENRDERRDGDQSKRLACVDCRDVKKKKRVKIYGNVENFYEIEQDRKAVMSSSDEESDHQEKRKKRTLKSDCQRRRVITQLVRYSSSEVENEEEPKMDNEMRMYESPYTEHMKTKIQALPLPPILKRYVNYFREF